MKESSPSNGSSPAPKPGGWRVWVSWFLVLLFAGEITAALLVARPDKTIAVSKFASLPLVSNGRIQPMDSLARNSLLQIRGITEVPLEGNGDNGAWGTWEELRAAGPAAPLHERRWYQFMRHPQKLKPSEWLLEVFCDPTKADDRYLFAINHPDLRSLLELDNGLEKSGLHFYRYNDLKAQYTNLFKEAQRAGGLESSQQKSFDRAVVQLANAWQIYSRLKNTIQPEDTQDLSAELEEYQASVAAARAAVQARQEKGERINDEALDALIAPIRKKFTSRYEAMAGMKPPLVVPPLKAGGHAEGWQTVGDLLLDAPNDGVPEPVRHFAVLATAYRAGNVAKVNQALTDYRTLLDTHGLSAATAKGAQETFFNRLLAFKRSMYVYITAFLLVLLYWANLKEVWRVTALRLILLGFVVHTAGLIFRMWLEGRPPVTNLYSSAIFIGWGAVILGCVLERFYKDGIGLAVASCVGFLTLIIAHNLALGGDTMIMLQAVLDTNFWLATHVVVVTLGYASTFVAGFLALVYILRGVFTRTLNQNTARGLARMIYGIVCFATLFSFVGTVLGGIWADQSWGRFWGWDPKENGALIIVLWNALILHARWGGLVKERGLVNLAIIGNVVTSWSWFGVNMLEIGLHSYGFMNAAFKWLMLFVVAQLVFVGLGLLPTRFWRSFGRSRVPAENVAAAAGI